MFTMIYAVLKSGPEFLTFSNKTKSAKSVFIFPYYNEIKAHWARMDVSCVFMFTIPRQRN